MTVLSTVRDSIRKAVVPIAGLGTRLFPASHACKKELFPVVGLDGRARPLLHYQLMDLVNAGIEEICIIVQPGEDRLVLDYLRGPDRSYLRRLEKQPELLQETEMMLSVLDLITIVVQQEQEGYGHAVYQSRNFSAGRPVLLCLGDHLFRSKHESCHRQLMRAFEHCDSKCVSAVNRITADELCGYGTIAGARRQDHPDIIDVSLIIEKPSAEVARKSLRVDGLGDDEFLGWFGMHALSPAIYVVLEEMIAEGIRQKGEIQLTQAQELVRQREGYCALEISDGQRFDFGTPQGYIDSLVAYAAG